MADIINEIRNHLFEMQDLKYKDFHAKLIPTIDSEKIIGVRTPEMRKYAKELIKTYGGLETIGCEENPLTEFFRDLPHKYYEEMNLQGFIIEAGKNYDKIIEELEPFLPHVDNWATCDLVSPKLFRKNHDKLIVKIREWMDSDELYTVRFGIEQLMSNFLTEDFKLEYLDWVAEIRSEEYYLNMMIAWFFAEALAKQYDSAIAYIEGRRLAKWTHNKAIQKAIESYRITPEQKDYLRTLRWKQ